MAAMVVMAPLRRTGARTGYGARALAVLVAMSLATPVHASAPAGDASLTAATATYNEGIAERDAGNFVAAAESFTEAYEAIPVDAREIRAAVLFDLVDARRQAYASGEGPAQICECQRLLVTYLADIKQAFASKGDKFPDTRKAKKLLVEVRKDLATLIKEMPGLDCSTTSVARPPEPEPTPEPTPPPPPEPTGPTEAELQANAARDRRARTLTIAGAVTTGVGGLFLGMMAGGLVVGRRAEQAGVNATHAGLAAGQPLSGDDPELRAIVGRGKLGNGLAIAGGVLATVAVAAGVSLLVLGLRTRRGPPRAAVAPAVAPGFAGAGLVVRF